MAEEKMLTGCSAAAQAAKSEVEVICSYPRPYTAIMMELVRSRTANWTRNSYTAKRACAVVGRFGRGAPIRKRASA
jgi:hypothetical protein